MRQFKKIMMFAAVTAMFFTACGKDDPDETGEEKAKIENLAVTPSTDLKYGDEVTLSAALSDAKGLRSYEIRISNAEGELYQATDMLTGTSFTLNKKIVIPLPKNAVASDLKLELTVKNSGNQLTTEEKTFANVGVPVFETLYLSLGTRILTMEKNDDGLFICSGLIAANATGKIYVNAEKTGLFWGKSETGEIVSLADNDITVGVAEEKNLIVTFNAVTFELTVGEGELWTEINEPVYIMGNISGHWEDGNITDERAKMKMAGYVSGNKKYWTWTPPNTGSSNSADDMWGNIKPGKFRFKIGGKDEYVLYKDGTIVGGSTNDENASFITSAGGPLTIKLFYDGEKYTLVSLENEIRSLEFGLNGSININGSPAPSAVTFAGAALTLKEGSLYVYEGTANLTKGSSISASGTNLSTANADPDLFTGQGNATWQVTGPTGNYTIRTDPFASTIYAANQAGYPDVIYMDGWSWAKFDSDPEIVWMPESRLTLYRKDASSYIYEAKFYHFGWNEADASFWAAYYNDTDAGKKVINAKYFDGVTASGVQNMKTPLTAGYYIVSVNLQDGFTFDETALDEANNFVLNPTNNKKFTVTFTPL
ncbi:MAG: hypothetical protein LBH32_09375 [Dysgonamonadaceae bacterium]|jgi:hypothetical protein|nr:hypothetical protein [Dysgonamonadaceae bacterium]